MRWLVILVLLVGLGCGKDDPVSSGGSGPHVEFDGAAGHRYWFINNGSELAVGVRATIYVCTRATYGTTPSVIKPGDRGYVDVFEDHERCGRSVESVTWQ